MEVEAMKEWELTAFKKHKEEFANKRKERDKKKYTCVCGSICSIAGKSEHERSQKHQIFISLPI